MAEQFLSQDEVDALLEGVTGESQKLDATEDTGGTRDYDISSQERIVRGRMPTMEIINERFARNLRVGLFNFMRRSPEISVGPVRVIKYSQFLRDIVVPTNINIITISPLRGQAMVIFEPNLVFCVIDTLLGGTGKLHLRTEGRDPSPTEARIIQRMMEVTLAEYTKAWGALHKFNFVHQRSEMQTQFANIASPSEIVVATTFSIEIGDTGGEIHLCFPYAALEPIRDILYSSLQGDGQEPDHRWVRQLTQQVQSADVELTAQLSKTMLTVGDLLKLGVGDFVALPLREVINATIDSVPVMECRYGVANNKYAIRVEKMLKYSHYADGRALDDIA